MVSKGLIFVLFFVLVFTSLLILVVAQSEKSINGDILPESSWIETDNGNDPDNEGAVFTGDKLYGDRCQGEDLIEMIGEEKKRRGILALLLGAGTGQPITVRHVSCGCEVIEDFQTVNWGVVDSAKCTEVTTGTCIDSDQGQDGDGNKPNVAGMVVIRDRSTASWIEDGRSGNDIIEQYCGSDGIRRSARHSCVGAINSMDVTLEGVTKTAYYCKVEPLTCGVTDFGIRYTDSAGVERTRNNGCVGSDLKTWTCNVDNVPIPETETCMLGCFEGACREATCTDTDNGMIVRSQGTATSGNYVGTDLCLSGNKVLEFSCLRDTSSRIHANVIGCPYGTTCRNGACVAGTTGTTPTQPTTPTPTQPTTPTPTQPTTPSTSISENGLILYIPREGQEIRDESGGTRMHLSCGGSSGVTCPSYVANAKVGGGSRFTDGGGIIGEDAHSDALTVSTWVKMEGANDWYHLVSKRSCCNDQNDFEWSLQTGKNSDQFVFGVNVNGRIFWTFSGASNTLTNKLSEWVHLTGTYDGQFVRLYVNGNMVSRSQVVHGGSIPNGGAIKHIEGIPIVVGARTADSFGNGVSGSARAILDEVKVYNRALSDSEIQALQA